MIPFLDLQASYIELKQEVNEAVQRVLDSGWYVLGEEVNVFEQEYAEFVGANYCVGVGNGLDALVLALKALDVGVGDEVIVPSNTYIATWLAVSMVGALPVPVEPDINTHCMDPTLVESAITDKTKVLLPVHLYGHPANLPKLWDICKKYKLRMLEDGAQAHGASVGATSIGHSRDLVAWSFYPGKNLGAFGDGGAITTNDKNLSERLAVLRNYGSSAKYINTEKGVNSRLDPMQAAVLRVKLKHLVNWNNRRKLIALRYSSEIRSTELILPSVGSGVQHAWHLYVVRSIHRAAFQQKLADGGIQTLIHYPVPPFRQQAYSEFAGQSWPIAEQLANEVLSLPIGPHMSDEDVELVIDVINHAVD